MFRLGKRIFDIVFSLSGLIILFPLFIIIAFLIKLNDGGPVIFKQRRVGRGGMPFNIYKFNSIRTKPSTKEGLFGPGDISDSTPFGKFLRKTKMNELPQLMNVLKGEMSFVGPRPEIEKWVAVYPERWAKALQVRPGITDKASIMFLNEEFILLDAEDPRKIYRDIILPRKLDLYEDYVNNHSMIVDLKIIFNTLSLLLFNHHFSKKTRQKSAPATETGKQEAIIQKQ